MATRRDKLVAEVFGDELAISPSDLCNHETRRQLLLGYNRKAIDTLLERAADVLESLIEQIRATKAENDELRSLLEEHRQMESTLRNALVSSQKFSEEIVESARREAQAIVSEAQARKSETELEAARIPEHLAKEIRVLEEQRDRLRREIVAVLDSHRTLLNNLLPGQAAPRPPSFYEVDESDDRADAVVKLGSRNFETNSPPYGSSNGEPEAAEMDSSKNDAAPVEPKPIKNEHTAESDTGDAAEETRK